MNRTERKDGFTLIELLVVIGIIGILVAIILPSVGRMRRAAEISRAHAEVRQIESGIMAYYTQYGKLPIPDEVQGLSEDDASQAQGLTQGRPPYFTVDNRYNVKEQGMMVKNHGTRDVIKILTHTTRARQEGGSSMTDVHLVAGTYNGRARNTATADEMNPRGIVFLEAQRAPRDETEAGIFQDPWGIDYNIKFDADYDGKVEWFSGGGGADDANVTKRAVVYSMGPGIDPEVPHGTHLPNPNFPDVVASHF